ncbi:hypothetical protein ACUR5C_08320 [Aliikangiella sp. IMCC44653]
MKQNLLLMGVFFVVFSFHAFSQEPTEKQQNFREEFDNFANSQQESFNQFLAQRDQEFLKMLKQNWQEFEAMAPLVRDARPKPTEVPSVSESNKSNTIDKVAPDLAGSLISETLTPNRPIKGLKGDLVSIVFFGNKLELPILSAPILKSSNQNGLTQYWQDSAQRKSAQLIGTLNQYKSKLQLSDWAFWKLVGEFAEKATKTKNDALALSWFLLNKAGFKARVAFNENSLVLLMPSAQKVYGVSYYNFDGERYYLFSTQGKKNTTGKITSYQGDYNAAGLKVDLSFDKSVKTKPTIKNRVIDFRINERKYQLSLPYDYQRIKYFVDYPQLDLVHYFKAPIDEITKVGLRKIKQKLLGDSTQKLNQLLAIIHQAFPYAIDEQQFGKENYLMIEETLHYQASDCEDRAVLFAWLAKHLLNENIVGLNYPGHVSTGVERNGKIQSADPTYIGATVGQVMPDYTKVNAEVIRF